MLEITKEDKERFADKLKLIGLDLENIPEFLKDFQAPDFRPSKRFDNKEYLVYRYIPVQKIQIMITKANRLTDIKEKYSLAKPISEYLEANNEEQIENFATFLNMLRNTDTKEIVEVEEKQKELNKAIPYKVRYEKNYLWQIYYSEYTDQYFMLVPSDDAEFGGFFYLLKEQIKLDKKKQKQEYIYVPISNIEPASDILTKSERADLENYLWLFTKSWPNIYEVTEKNETCKIIIVGESQVYPSIFATYRVELANREEASRFYKELKALFILQTELPDYYSFNCQIDEHGNLHFFYKNEKINYEELSDFIKKEYLETEKNIKKSRKDLKKWKIKLNNLKLEANNKEKEFLEKQREISTYLQYKKTFLGRVKYFFSRKKTANKQDKEEKKVVTADEEKQDENIEEKANYTIEDLVTIYAIYDKIADEAKNEKMDADALELKIKNLTKKIENATLYINEIDSHKKSIFEFWKFSSKDDMLALNTGENVETEQVENKLRKVFDYESDREDVTNQIDKLQRDSLSKEEQDTIFVTNSQILPILNKIKTLVKVTDSKLFELLEELKQESEEEKKYDVIQYDIFGGLSEDKTKIKILGKNKHRETEKNKFQILGINNDISLNDFKEKLKNTEANLEKCFEKVKNVIDMPIYKAIPAEEKIDVYGFEMYSMVAEEELRNLNSEENECNLLKINLKEGMPAVFYTNIMFFDNYNKTLPLGMEKSNNVMINSDDFSFILKDKKTVWTNEYFTKEIDGDKLLSKKVNIYEYDIELKNK